MIALLLGFLTTDVIYVILVCGIIIKDVVELFEATKVQNN